MTTTTEASTEPDYFRQACAAHFAHGAIEKLLDGDPNVRVMRLVLRDVLVELRRAGIGEGQTTTDVETCDVCGWTQEQHPRGEWCDAHQPKAIR